MCMSAAACRRLRVAWPQLVRCNVVRCALVVACCLLHMVPMHLCISFHSVCLLHGMRGFCCCMVCVALLLHGLPVVCCASPARVRRIGSVCVSDALCCFAARRRPHIACYSSPAACAPLRYALTLLQLARCMCSAAVCVDSCCCAFSAARCRPARRPVHVVCSPASHSFGCCLMRRFANPRVIALLRPARRRVRFVACCNSGRPVVCCRLSAARCAHARNARTRKHARACTS